MHTWIKELKTEEAWRSAFPVMKQLRTHLDEQTFVELVRNASDQNDYRLFALFADGKPAAVCGFLPMITLYNGKSIWVCDLVTDANCRSKGYGHELLAYVENWAEDHAYSTVSLSSGLQRTDAHRFYSDKMDYARTSYVFLKKLT